MEWLDKKCVAQVEYDEEEEEEEAIQPLRVGKADERRVADLTWTKTKMSRRRRRRISPWRWHHSTRSKGRGASEQRERTRRCRGMWPPVGGKEEEAEWN